jgi:Predicted amino acid aldolase or racemase
MREPMETPQVSDNLDILDANLRRTAELAAKAGIKLRPHTKTHKSVWACAAGGSNGS